MADPDPLVDKTTVVFSLPNEPGALFKALVGVCAARHRPHQDRVAPDPRTALGYLFYVDLPLGRHDLRCSRALVHLAEFARSMRTLGSYKSWKSREAATASQV